MQLSSQGNNPIKFTHCDGPKKRAHDSEIVIAKKPSSWATVGPVNDKHQAPTNGENLYVSVVIKSEAWPTVVQLKRKP